MKNVLTVFNLSKTYNSLSGEVKAVDKVSFNLRDGEFIAIVGPSGCGKSTILSIIMGLDKEYEGEIIANKEKIGYMLQSDSLLPWLNIRNNCLIGLKLKNICNSNYDEYVDNLLQKYGLDAFKYKKPASLSGGMKQRVALIRTLATKPDVLLLDEPFSALDYQTRLAVCDDVYKIIKDEGKSAIIVTHDIAEAISMADRVIVLSNRPANIKNIYKIDLKNKGTPMENRSDENFKIYYELIWKDIDLYVK